MSEARAKYTALEAVYGRVEKELQEANSKLENMQVKINRTAHNCSCVRLAFGLDRFGWI